MRPAIKDSLTSGQPLYLLYWNSKRGWPAGSAPLLRAFETHATGSVRLQVTGSPPTTKGAPWVFPFDPFPQESALKGKAAAISPWTTCLRFKACSSTVRHRLRRRNIIGSAPYQKQSGVDRFSLSRLRAASIVGARDSNRSALAGIPRESAGEPPCPQWPPWRWSTWPRFPRSPYS